ncbi:DUF4920 domain-containing protein [Niabella ginsenosidivorans]|uniref:DUF4920 domain-containing protein n=1 Tax=Niabella ginsenosidivorans TaxID=1176587 RepID=A0A1A9I924_9BACT|nr:DUF4920 domain-containing protein [Niabella ginsenosidivorans]ANH83014.1 DUF4920 domain-containing protein [Niabella ginsenosidivorans]
MGKGFLLLAAVMITASVYAQPPAGEAKKGDTYGEKISARGAISVMELVDKMHQTDTLQTRVTGKVLDVCPKKGCWLTLELPDKSGMFVKSRNYNIFVPVALKGKTVVLEGVAFNKTTSVSELKHYAEDAKKTQAEIDAITEPQKEIRFQPTGVLVL